MAYENCDNPVVIGALGMIKKGTEKAQEVQTLLKCKK